MPRSQVVGSKRDQSGSRPKVKPKSPAEGLRYTVGLPSGLARRVERYAGTVDTSMSKAIATLVRLGLESQEERKREFFKRLKENLADGDPANQDRMVDEFRSLILGR
jgi:hypothetical protein